MRIAFVVLCSFQVVFLLCTTLGRFLDLRYVNFFLYNDTQHLETKNCLLFYCLSTCILSSTSTYVLLYIVSLCVHLFLCCQGIVHTTTSKTLKITRYIIRQTQSASLDLALIPALIFNDSCNNLSKST